MLDKFIKILRLSNLAITLSFFYGIFILLKNTSEIDQILYQIKGLDYQIVEQNRKIKDLNTTITLLTSYDRLTSISEKMDNLVKINFSEIIKNPNEKINSDKKNIEKKRKKIDWIYKKWNLPEKKTKNSVPAKNNGSKDIFDKVRN